MDNETNARIIKVDGSTELKLLTKLEEMQAAVGGYIEPVYQLADPHYRDMIMIVNEEGIPRGLDQNPEATRISGQPIFGDVFIMTREDWDKLA